MFCYDEARKKGEKMTLIIENVKEEFLPAFRGLSKSIHAKMRTEKKELRIKKEAKKSNKRLLKAMKEAEKIEMNPQSYPSYASAKELIKDCFK